MSTILAPDHKGMMIEGLRVLRQNFSGAHYIRKEMAGHLEEVAQRFYAGDVTVVDEFLQLYRIGDKHRQEAKERMGQNAGHA